MMEEIQRRSLLLEAAKYIEEGNGFQPTWAESLVQRLRAEAETARKATIVEPGRRLSASFEFDLGQIVMHRSMQGLDAPVGFLIVERMIQQCHGGVQTHYLCRLFDRERMAGDLKSFASMELVAYPSEEEQAARRARRRLAVQERMREEEATPSEA